VNDFGVDLNLSEFFSAVGVEKKKKRKEIDELVSNSFDDFFIRPLQEEISQKKIKEPLIEPPTQLEEKPVEEDKNTKKLSKELDELISNSFKDFLLPLKEELNKTEIREEPLIEDELIEDILEEEIIPEENIENLIEKSLGLLSEPSNAKVQKDPLTPLDQKFATLEDLDKHYKIFLSRIQQQLSTIGGGGETRLEFLDDIDRNSAKTDNYFLKYNATLNKWIGDPADGVGITSIVSITGVTTYYQANDADDYIGVSANVPVTIVLPQIPSYGKKLVVKDEGNKINTYNITVQAGIGKSVENDISVTMSSNHQSFSFFYNGSNWYIV
jgi:hypothetical protein